MIDDNVGRNSAKNGLGAGALAVESDQAGKNVTGAAGVRVPYSAGTEAAKLKAPANACDCHHHISDTRVPFVAPVAAHPDATIADYRLLQKRIGSSRNLVVSASNDGATNEVITAAPQRMVRASDWPKVKPDDARVFDLTQEWAPDAVTWELILVRNPETLYGFPKTS